MNILVCTLWTARSGHPSVAASGRARVVATMIIALLLAVGTEVLILAKGHLGFDTTVLY